MKKILLSVSMIVFVGVVVVGATGAFFSDTETSKGNTFTAGSIDLKLDSQSHYAGLVCNSSGRWELEDSTTTRPDLVGDSCDGTWTETDLGADHTFFNFTDLKPGDEGENTISIHVYSNDSWLRYRSDNAKDWENTCNEAEVESGDTSCGTGDDQGEMSANLDWHVWLDQGTIPGFQNIGADGNPVSGEVPDPKEGDNIQNTEIEFTVLGGDDEDNAVDGLWPFENGVQYFFAEALTGAYLLGSGSGSPCTVVDGSTGYTLCQGLALDGRIVGSTTYYFGTAWCLGTFDYGTSGSGPQFNPPVACDGSTVSNTAQTDSLVADNVYEVVQHRNNPSATF